MCVVPLDSGYTVNECTYCQGLATYQCSFVILEVHRVGTVPSFLCGTSDMDFSYRNGCDYSRES